MSAVSNDKDASFVSAVEKVGPRPMSVLPPNGSLTDQQSQEVISLLQGYINKLKSNDFLGHCHDQKSKAVAAAAVDTPYLRDTILLYTKKWTIFELPWLNMLAFNNPPNLNAPEPKSSLYYQSKDSFLEGLITKLDKSLVQISSDRWQPNV
ncbi:hypothetical protein L218DRAFT_1001310 [Marasmius fiardii PR-910]|nr:hypothetical protein L218DRAFT_1001310 [Marasmius fiardii PR-910]